MSHDDYYDIEDQVLKQEKEEHRLKTSDDFKTTDFVLDFATTQIIYKLQNKLIIHNLTGTIATGKESAVFIANSGREFNTLPESKNYHQTPPTHVALKVYKTSTLEFKRIQSYIQGDPRFKAYKKTTRGFMKVWASKEFRNLKRMKNSGMRVPFPFYVKENILIMEFIGNGDEREPAPKLHDVSLDENQAIIFYDDIIHQVEICYKKAKLIHGDLSEYNILCWENKPWIIDVSQAVTLDHPMADFFLLRDINNLQSYFLEYIKIEEGPIQCFKKITGKKPNATALAQVTLHNGI